MFLRRGLQAVSWCPVTALLSAAAPAPAQSSGDYKVARRLGGVTTRISPPLRDRAAPKRLGTNPRLARDLRTALTDAGLSEIADEVIDILESLGLLDVTRGGVRPKPAIGRYRLEPAIEPA